MIQRGILKLQNGEIINFAFLSHHASKDRDSHSYFIGSNYRKYVTGCFCCEVEFYNKSQPKDTAELDSLLLKNDQACGRAPGRPAGSGGFSQCCPVRSLHGSLKM
jgi:hypothetical protein